MLIDVQKHGSGGQPQYDGSRADYVGEICGDRRLPLPAHQLKISQIRCSNCSQIKCRAMPCKRSKKFMYVANGLTYRAQQRIQFICLAQVFELVATFPV